MDGKNIKIVDYEQRKSKRASAYYTGVCRRQDNRVQRTWLHPLDRIRLANFEYRIKPEPKYRPFKDAEECWQEMQKHQPFGWLKHKEEKENYHILKITDSRISMIDVCEEVTFYDYNETFKQYTFADGTPFGIKE